VYVIPALPGSAKRKQRLEREYCPAMFRNLWARLGDRRRAAQDERETEERGMSRAERDFAHERVEDHAADEESTAHLGGVDPKRLLGD
jgi:hypothetical protein